MRFLLPLARIYPANVPDASKGVLLASESHFHFSHTILPLIVLLAAHFDLCFAFFKLKLATMSQNSTKMDERVLELDDAKKNDNGANTNPIFSLRPLEALLVAPNCATHNGGPTTECGSSTLAALKWHKTRATCLKSSSSSSSSLSAFIATAGRDDECKKE